MGISVITIQIMLEIIAIVIAEDYDRGKNIESMKMYFIAFWFLIVYVFLLVTWAALAKKNTAPSAQPSVSPKPVVKKVIFRWT